MSTPRPDSVPPTGAETDRTVQLGAAAAGAAQTVRLGPVPAAEERTVTLDQPAAAPATASTEASTAAPAAAPTADGPDAEATARLDGVQVVSAPVVGAAADRTVRLGAPVAGEGRTVEPGRAATPPAAEAGSDAASATFLDPRAWGGASDPGETATAVDPLATAPGVVTTGPATTRAPGPAPAADPAEKPFAPGELRRFGPGVPPQAAAVWHGAAVPDAQQPRRPRRMRRWLVPIAVLLAVLAFLYWRFTTPALAVTGVGVTTDPAGPGCGGTALITAAVETNGGAGTIRYRWLRSDGTTSDEIAQEVRSGTHRTDLVLRWSFEGQGSLQATATLDLLSPGPRTAAASFAYHCP
ncbi:hypothetical protein ACFVVX_23530 [Kitasatospora sp. NPDC058170]|uniref:hypothetical protein n=1 Tax=Kitasatospora sp. NPDC058170 TaxID=3346364 RepID=UPI0036DF4870